MKSIFKVYFRKYKSDTLPIDSNYVILSKSGNDYNDFGHKAIYDLVIVSHRNKPIYIRDGYKVIFNNKEEIQKIFDQSEIDLVPVGSINFLGQIQNEKYYREIFNYLNNDEARAISLLQSINDAATLRESAEVRSLDLTSNEAFYGVLIRSSDAYYAYKKGIYSIYKYTDEVFSTDNVFNKPMTFSFISSLASYKLTLDYTLNELLPSQVNLLVGCNGSGKSYTIKKLIELIYGKQVDSKYRAQNEVPGFNRLVLFSNTINDNYLATKNSVRDVLEPGSEYHYVNLINQKKFDLQFGVRRSYSTGWALHDILWRDWHEHSFFQKWEVLIELLKGIIIFDKILVPTRAGRLVPMLAPAGEQDRMKYLNSIDKKRDLVFINGGKSIELSSGQHSFVRFVFYAIALIEQNSLVIIDEPENFLHPNYEIEYVKLINKLLSETKSVGLLATHSSVIAREIPSQYISIFTRDKDGIFVGKPQIETYANNLHKISDYLFGDTRSSKAYIEHLVDLSDGETNIKRLLDKFNYKLDPDILSVIINKIAVA